MATLMALLLPLGVLLHTTTGLRSYSNKALDIIGTQAINDVIDSYNLEAKHQGYVNVSLDLSLDITVWNHEFSISSRNGEVHTTGLKLATELVHNEFRQETIRGGSDVVHQITANIPIKFENMVIHTDTLKVNIKKLNGTDTNLHKFTEPLRQLDENGIGGKPLKAKVLIGENKFRMQSEMYHFERKNECLVVIRHIRAEEMVVEGINVSGSTLLNTLAQNVIGFPVNELRAAKLIPFAILEELVGHKHLRYCEYVSPEVIDKILGIKPTAKPTKKPHPDSALDIIVTDVVNDVISTYNMYSRRLPHPLGIPDLVHSQNLTDGHWSVRATQGKLLGGDVRLASKITDLEFEDLHDGMVILHKVVANIPITFEKLALHYDYVDYDISSDTTVAYGISPSTRTTADATVGENKFILQPAIIHFNGSPCYFTIQQVEAEKFDVKNVTVSGLNPLINEADFANKLKNFLMDKSYAEDIIKLVFEEIGHKMFRYCTYVSLKEWEQFVEFRTLRSKPHNR